MSKLEQLRERIRKNKEKSEEIELSPFSRFILDNNIINGIDRVPAYVILYLYREFLKKNPEEYQLKDNEFFIYLKDILDSKRTKKGNFYLIDFKSLKNIPNDLLFKATLWKTNQKD